MWVEGFVRSAGVILVVTGLAKVWSGLGEWRVVGLEDPVFGLTFRQLMVGVGMVELLVGGVCLVGRGVEVGLVWVSWLAGSIGVYRLGLRWVGWTQPCGCLGQWTEALGVSPVVADRLMLGVLGYLLVGSMICWLVRGWEIWVTKRGSMKKAESAGDMVKDRLS